MSELKKFEFCELPATPWRFDEVKFKAGDPEQIKLYKKSKTPNRDAKLRYEDLKIDEEGGPNYARVVPDDCCFIDFDNPEEAEKMHKIVLHSGSNCLILKTIHGYHFLFRKPEFYEKEMSGATNWFGYKFDTKGPDSVQIIKVCGMERDEVCSWNPTHLIAPEAIDTEKLDVLPYWLWGKLKDKDLHKGGKPGKSEYHLTDTPFTQLMKMSEGGRHSHIVERCSYFAISNGFYEEEFKDLIRVINDLYLAELSGTMSESDMFGDLHKRWDEYEGGILSEGGYSFDDKTRTWLKAEDKKTDKIDERRASEWLYNQFDFYGKNTKADGTFDGLLYRNKEGSYDYQSDLTKIRQMLKDHSDQNFKEQFFKEVEVQLMQMCAANDKRIMRNDKYVIVKNKVLSCITKDAFDFDWLGKKPPTDVVMPWNWYPEEWVKEHEEDLGSIITHFIEELSRDASGKPQKEVQDWLWVIAGASMVPGNQLQKVVILSGGGQNGKSLYTSLIRLCLGTGMWNESKIFDVNPQDKFWGEDLDKGILCVIDDLVRTYNRESFSYIKGILTGTDSVLINEKFKPKKRLDVLPQIIACTNFEFELYDRSEGMKRRVKILPTEYHVPDELKDTDLEFKLVMNTRDVVKIAEYKMSEDAFSHKGSKAMFMYTEEKAVLDSLKDGSLAWFANKARYEYIKWLLHEKVLSDSEGMKERIEGTFAGGFDAEMQEFLSWYISEHSKGTWTRELYAEYVDWHTEMATGEGQMKEKAFSMKLGKTIKVLNEKGIKVAMRKRKNDKNMSLNYLFIGDEVDALAKEDES